jgi:hypothetical protein
MCELACIYAIHDDARIPHVFSYPISTSVE